MDRATKDGVCVAYEKAQHAITVNVRLIIDQFWEQSRTHDAHLVLQSVSDCVFLLHKRTSVMVTRAVNKGH